MTSGASDSAQPDAGVNIGIVILVNAILFAVALNWGEGAPGRDDRPTFCPGLQIRRCRLAAVGRIRQGENHRPVHVPCHIAYNIFSDRTSLPGGPDERRRMRIYNNVSKADAVLLCAFPASHTIAALCERQLKRLQATH